jgi:Icc-related predicted phosphoesterase
MSTKNLIGPFIKAKKKVLLIPGNHESLATIDTLTQIYPNTQSIHGYSFKNNNLGIFGAGAADIGINSINDSELFSVLKKGHETIKELDKKIMVTHMHPKGSKAEFSGFEGSKAIRKAIKEFKPNFLITAHIHEAAGLEEYMDKTKVINVSRKEKIFEI